MRKAIGSVISLTVQTPWFVLLVVLLALALVYGGCTRLGAENMLQDVDLTEWDRERDLPAGWQVEGEGLVVSPGTVRVEETGQPSVECFFADNVLEISSPFLYRKVGPGRLANGGTTVHVGGWVRTSAPGAVYIELSDRAGRDVKSPPHPGDGRWHYLSASSQVRRGTRVLEYRLRFNFPARADFGGMVMKAGLF